VTYLIQCFDHGKKRNKCCHLNAEDVCTCKDELVEPYISATHKRTSTRTHRNTREKHTLYLCIVDAFAKIRNNIESSFLHLTGMSGIVARRAPGTHHGVLRLKSVIDKRQNVYEMLDRAGLEFGQRSRSRNTFFSVLLCRVSKLSSSVSMF
jgi:hypothetical protein